MSENEKQENNFVPVSKFGKDHWSTFAYIETRIVDFHGEPNKQHMRCDYDRHPWHSHQHNDKKYPTILKGGARLENHDDWDCLDDLEAAGLLMQPEDRGTGMFPVYALTEIGIRVASELRMHKANGGNFSSFEPSNL